MSASRELELQQILNSNPEYIRPEYYSSVVEGKVVKNMTLIEAYYAANSSYSYSVSPDLSVWDKNTDPLQIIQAQATRPDKSEISLTFYNTTQFDTEKPVGFKVITQENKVLDIQPIKE